MWVTVNVPIEDPPFKKVTVNVFVQVVDTVALLNVELVNIPEKDANTG